LKADLPDREVIPSSFGRGPSKFESGSFTLWKSLPS
jgi:hypothetical protein